MNSDSTETEIKIWVDDLHAVTTRLRALGAALAAPRVFERNNRYDRSDGSLTASGIVLRLRQDSRARLTYKEPGSIQDGVISRFEAELEVSNFDTAAKILERLGFIFSFAYEKYRTTYRYGDCEIVLDEMPFGSFVEVEGSHAAILRVVAEIGLDAAPRVAMSYAAAFDRVRELLGLRFTDATFENFAHLDLPANLRERLTGVS
jgi:adenylate cyclase, class 2